MATITGITSSVPQGSPCTITGTLFGASQGASLVFFSSVGGALVSPTITSWGNTSITFTVPANADVSANASAVVLISSTTVGVRSANFAVTAAVAPKTDYVVYDLISIVPTLFVPILPGFLSPIGLLSAVGAGSTMFALWISAVKGGQISGFGTVNGQVLSIEKTDPKHLYGAASAAYAKTIGIYV